MLFQSVAGDHQYPINSPIGIHCTDMIFAIAFQCLPGYGRTRDYVYSGFWWYIDKLPIMYRWPPVYNCFSVTIDPGKMLHEKVHWWLPICNSGFLHPVLSCYAGYIDGLPVMCRWPNKCNYAAIIWNSCHMFQIKVSILGLPTGQLACRCQRGMGYLPKYSPLANHVPATIWK